MSHPRSPTAQQRSHHRTGDSATSKLLFVVLVVVVARTFDLVTVDHRLVAVTSAAALVVGYGLLQLVGADPLPWEAEVGGRLLDAW